LPTNTKFLNDVFLASEAVKKFFVLILIDNILIGVMKHKFGSIFCLNAQYSTLVAVMLDMNAPYSILNFILNQKSQNV
jgi:hypothetical protein